MSESFQDKMSLLVWVEQCAVLNLDELRASTQSKLDHLRNKANELAGAGTSGGVAGGSGSAGGAAGGAAAGAAGASMGLPCEPRVPLPMQILPASFVETSAPAYITEMWREKGDKTACMQFCSCKGKVAFRTNVCFQNNFMSEQELGMQFLTQMNPVDLLRLEPQPELEPEPEARARKPVDLNLCLPTPLPLLPHPTNFTHCLIHSMVVFEDDKSEFIYSVAELLFSGPLEAEANMALRTGGKDSGALSLIEVRVAFVLDESQEQATFYGLNVQALPRSKFILELPRVSNGHAGAGAYGSRAGKVR